MFTPGALWPDDRGVHINAHGGGVLFHDGAYWWFGEHKIAGQAGNRAHVGVHCYRSTDLAHWSDEGIALAVVDDPAHDLARGNIIERPKVVRNRAGQFVMWFHLDNPTYDWARSGVAIAEQPQGPYRYVHGLRPSAGHWPINVRPEQQDPASIAAARAEGERFGGGESAETPRFNILGRDFATGQHARDMTLFADDDGAVYHVYSSEHNSTLHIARLSDDCLTHTGEYARVFEHRWMEAPALFKHRGRYYFLGSGCTGWQPNPARAAVADSIWGPWRELPNPCTGVNATNGLGPEKTFGGQSTFVLPVQGRDGAFIAMFDLWRPKDAIDGRYLWLPVRIRSEGFQIPWMDTWDVDVFDT